MTGPGRAPVTVPATILAALALVSSVIGLLDEGGPGRQVVRTYRGAEVILYGEGLYAADAWLQRSGNRGQDLAIVLVEVPLLLVAVWWYRKRGTVAPAALTGVLAFFTYFYASMVFATAQNRLFPMYVAAAALAGFGLVFVAGRMDVPSIAAALPDRPGRLALVIYLLAVAAALVAAWLPEMLATAITGDIAEAVGPYTSAATEALDLGVVVPVAVIAAIGLLRRKAAGLVLAFVMLVINVCIGILLMAQGVAQLVSGVPMTVGEIVGKMMSFAVLTLVAGGLLVRMAVARSGVPSQLARNQLRGRPS
jgi:hypothetical protein